MPRTPSEVARRGDCRSADSSSPGAPRRTAAIASAVSASRARATSKCTVGVASSPSSVFGGRISPCEPPETEGKASRNNQTSHASNHVPTATNARRSRTTPPEISPATSAAAAPASTAGSSGQPERATSSDDVKAPTAMNAPAPSEGRPAAPTVRPSPVAATARYTVSASESSRTPGNERNGTSATSRTAATTTDAPLLHPARASSTARRSSPPVCANAFTPVPRARRGKATQR